jgi:glycosyltransferase involved in cell wall biosynthesis
MNMITLSIITINYNDAEGLRKTLASVAAQTYPNIEHIIVDGNSTDGSVEVIRQYVDNQAIGESLEAKGTENGGSDSENNPTPIYTTLHNATPPKHRVLWVSEPDKGIYNAMNKGIEIGLGRRKVKDNHTSSPITYCQSPIVQTEYFQFLNSGDMLYAPDVTERMVNALIERQKTQSRRIGVIYGNMIKDMPNGTKQLDRCNGGEDVTLNMFYRGCLNHSPAYIHKSLFEKYGLYDESLRICSDWKFYLQSLVLGGEKVVYEDIDMTLFDMTGISETQKDLLNEERNRLLSELIPSGILHDYELYHFPIEQYRRLKKYHLWGVVYFIERVLFKLEKWRIIK